MTIHTFGKDEHKAITARILAAIKDIEKEFGVTIANHGGTVGKHEGVIKLGVKVNTTASGINPEEENFKRYAELFGMKPDWFGKWVPVNGTPHKIVGLNARASKNTVIIESKRGTRYVTNAEVIVKGMKG